MNAAGRFAKRVTVKDTAGLAIGGTTIATSGEVTKAVKMGPYNSFGFWLDISQTNGSSETLDITFEWSEDSTTGVDGTFAAIVEAIDGKRTAASMTQITTTTGAFATYFANPASSAGWIRAKFTIGGSSTPGYVVDSAYWSLKDAA